MRIGVPKETAPGERRVALVPESGKKLKQAGYDIAIESGAGAAAGYPDAAYLEAGVVVEPDPAAVLGAADVALKVGPPSWMVSGTKWPGCGPTPSISGPSCRSGTSTLSGRWPIGR